VSYWVLRVCAAGSIVSCCVLSGSIGFCGGHRAGGFYLLLLTGLRAVLPILALAQQVGEGQGLEGARARRPGAQEALRGPLVPLVPLAAHGAQRARPQAARRVDAVDANHGSVGRGGRRGGRRDDGLEREFGKAPGSVGGG